MADKALETGSVEKLSAALASHMAAVVQERFNRAAETQRHAADSVEAGRAFVAAYVEFTNYVESLHQAVVGAASHHEDAGH